MKITSQCVGCAQCVVFCPTGAITVFGKADITGDCTGCGVCLKFCPQQAIGLNNGM